MAYSRQTWSRGQVLTADGLNHMEEGILEASSQANSLRDSFIVNSDNANDNKIITKKYIDDTFFKISNNSTPLYTKNLTVGIQDNSQFQGETVFNTAQNTFNGTTTMATLTAASLTVTTNTTLGNTTSVGTINITTFGTIPLFNTDAANRNYGIQKDVNNNGALFVNVPWIQYSASTGLTLNNNSFSLNTASANALGGIKVGNYLTMNDGTLNINVASSNTLGGVKVGDKLTIDNGVLNANIASTNVLGLVKIGNNLTIDNNGLLSGNYSEVTTSSAGLMSIADKTKLDGINIISTIDNNTNGNSIPTVEALLTYMENEYYITSPEPVNFATGEKRLYSLTMQESNGSVNYNWEETIMPPDTTGLTTGIYNYTLQVTVNSQGKISYNWVQAT